MIRGILFDKDGTLIEFEKTWHQIMTLVFERLKAEGLVEEELQALKLYAGYGDGGFTRESAIQYRSTREIIDDWVEILGRKEEEYVLHLLDIFDVAATDHRVKIRPLEGVEKSLAYLKDKGYALGIATADTKESADHSLIKAGIYEYFSFYGTDDGKMLPKPHAQMAHAFCAQSGLLSTELLVVGDSVNDLRFAQISGAHFVGMRAKHSVLEKKSKEPVLMVSTLPELVEKLGL